MVWTGAGKIAECTPITIRQLQRLRDNGHQDKHKEETKLSRHMQTINDEYLWQGITNSLVILSQIRKEGYTEGASILRKGTNNERNQQFASILLAMATTMGCEVCFKETDASITLK